MTSSDLERRDERATVLRGCLSVCCTVVPVDIYRTTKFYTVTRGGRACSRSATPNHYIIIIIIIIIIINNG